jgi:hypothetical protein
MSKAVSYPYDGKLLWHSKHPDTGEHIKRSNSKLGKGKGNVLIWPESFLIPYIGWDIVLSDDSILVLEG